MSSSVPPTKITVGEVLRAVDGPLAGVRCLRPEATAYEGTAAHLSELWVAVRSAVRSVVDEVSLAQLASGPTARSPSACRWSPTTPH